MSASQKNIILILDNLRSVHNVASLFRSADCFGVSKIYLCGTTPTPVDRFGRVREDFKKVSLGAELSMLWEYYEDTCTAIDCVRQQGFVVGALEQSSKSVSLHSYATVTNDFALVLGAEVIGVDSNIIEAADVVLEIRQFGSKESLNVCVAGSVALYHLRFVAGMVNI